MGGFLTGKKYPHRTASDLAALRNLSGSPVPITCHGQMIKHAVPSLNKSGKIQKVGHCFLPSGTTSQPEARRVAGGLLPLYLKK